MFTIHALANGHYIPLAFAVLNSKESVLYQRVLRVVIEACAVRGILFQPDVIYSDFENMYIHYDNFISLIKIT